MLTPHSTKDGVPFVPLPLNMSGIVTDWSMNHRTGQVKYNGTERVVVTPVPGKLCIVQHGLGPKVGKSKCLHNWIALKSKGGTESNWTCQTGNITHTNTKWAQCVCDLNP